jgi:hypothetical protein
VGGLGAFQSSGNENCSKQSIKRLHTYIHTYILVGEQSRIVIASPVERKGGREEGREEGRKLLYKQLHFTTFSFR